MREARMPPTICARACAFVFLATCVLAQDSSPSCSTSTATISNAADASALSSCATFTGDIAVSTGASDAIALDQLEVLDGSLLIQSADDLSSFSAAQLSSVTGYVYIEHLENLESLNFPNLTTIQDQLRLNDLAILSQPGFGRLSTCPLVTVSGCTRLASLSGIDPGGTTRGLNITNNKNLQGDLSFSLDSTRATPQTAIAIADNGPGLAVSFPNLTTAQSISLSNLSAVALPQLTEAYELLLLSNTFERFAAPKLEAVGNASALFGVLLHDNQGLAAAQFPALARTGGFEAKNNSRLAALALPMLDTVRGDINLEGSFNNVSLPALQSVQTVVLATSDAAFDCAPLHQYRQQGIIADALTCDTSNSSTAPSSSNPASSSTGLSTGAKAGIGAGVGVGGVLALAALAFFLLRRRRRSAQKKRQRHARASSNDTPPMAEQGGLYDKPPTPPGYSYVHNYHPGVAPASSPPLLGTEYGFPSPTTPEQQGPFGAVGGGGKRSGEGGRSAVAGVSELEATNQVHELQASREWVEMGGEQRQGGWQERGEGKK